MPSTRDSNVVVIDAAEVVVGEGAAVDVFAFVVDVAAVTAAFSDGAGDGGVLVAGGVIVVLSFGPSTITGVMVGAVVVGGKLTIGLGAAVLASGALLADAAGAV